MLFRYCHFCLLLWNVQFPDINLFKTLSPEPARRPHKASTMAQFRHYGVYNGETYAYPSEARTRKTECHWA